MPTIAATPSASWRSATSRRAPGWPTCPPASSTPTPPGCWLPPWPTTCCAGPPASASASVTSKPSPRPCGARCWRCPGGSPAPPAAGGCTCPPAGHGPTPSPWRWRGCAASPTRPDHRSTPRLGWSAGRRPLQPARHGVGRTTQPLHDRQPTLIRHLQRLRRHTTRAPASHTLGRIRKSATAFADRWIEVQAAKAVDQGKALGAVAADWTKRGVPTVGGGAVWHHKVLRRILIDPRVVGKREYQGALIDVDYMPP